MTQIIYALESFPADAIAYARDLVLNITKEHPYYRFKEALLHHYLPWMEERLWQMLTRHPIGNAKPSRLLHIFGALLVLLTETEIVRELRNSTPGHVPRHSTSHAPSDRQGKPVAFSVPTHENIFVLLRGWNLRSQQENTAKDSRLAVCFMHTIIALSLIHI